MTAHYGKPVLKGPLRKIEEAPETRFEFMYESNYPVYFMGFMGIGHIGVSEEEEDGNPIYVVSYSGNVGKDRDGTVRGELVAFLKPILGEPLYEVKGGACDYLMYERKTDA